MKDQTKQESSSGSQRKRIGLWLVGARGAVSTCVAYGLHGLRAGTLAPQGLVTESEDLAGLDLPSLDDFVLGGHDVCQRDISQAAGELVRAGILDQELVASLSSEASAFEARLRPGPLDGPDVGVPDLDPASAELGAASPRQQIEQLQADWTQFESQNEVERTVIVLVASTEAARDAQPEWEDLEAFERALDGGVAQPASIIYAYAALASGRPLVNFTPSLGSTPPALRALAEREGVPHCGSDGKTGETLVKTCLAPMFRARNLRVLAWQGYNMLGNRDGEVLRKPAHRETKIRNKDEVLHDILGDGEPFNSKVGIDFVPSLGDWKTAMDFVHFEGFLGTRMSMQLTWSGCDSALAAPLVLDLVRLAAFAQGQGEVGVMSHTACFFKAPIAGGGHDFHLQYSKLLEYVRSKS